MGDQQYWMTRGAGGISRRRFLGTSALAGAGLAGAALIGCSSGSKTAAPAGSAVQGTPTAVANASAAKRGGVLRIAGQLGGDVPSLDYDRTNGSAMGSISNLTGVKLTQWDERPDSPGPVEAVIPDLAESWETPDQGLTYTFKLRKGVKTSDGLEVKAEDVVWTFERQAAIRTPLGVLEANLRDMYPDRKPAVKAIDDYTVQVKLARPDADFLPLMGAHWWAVEHKEVITKKGTDLGKTAPGYGDITSAEQIRGGGPFFPSEYVPASGFKMKRNPNFYDKNLLQGRGRSGSMVLPWLTYWALDPAKMGEDGKYLTTFDAAEAKKLLSAAGVEKFKFTLQTSNIGAYTVTYPFADLMQSMLANVGITQETKIVDYAAHIGGKTFPDNGIYQSFIVRPDIQSYAYAQVGMGGGTVGGKDVYGVLAKNDPEYVAFREVAEKQRITQDRNARRELIYDMQKRWARNVFNFYWPAPDSPVVSNKKVHNFRPPPGWNWNIMKYVWKDA